MKLNLGLNPWNQVFDWPAYVEVADAAERLGYDHLWSWDHLVAAMGSDDLDVHEPYTLVTAWSQVTSKVRLGVLTTANTFRNPGLLAKMVTTLDHVSVGRAILGIGGAWLDREHQQFGIAFGSGFGERLQWLDESVSIMRRLLDGEIVSSADNGHYAMDGARLHPLPLQSRLPILIGGAGERRTLKTVAQYADMWNLGATSDLEVLRHKDSVLRKWCDEVGRDHSEIERSVFVRPVIRATEKEAMDFFRVQMDLNGLDDSVMDHPSVFIASVERMSELVAGWVELGFSTVIVESAAPFDLETAHIFANEIRPLIDRA